MAKRFSQLRLKSMKNLQGKRQQKKEKIIKTTTVDLFGEDEVILPKIIQSIELPEVSYQIRSERSTDREFKNLNKEILKINKATANLRVQQPSISPYDIWTTQATQNPFQPKQSSITKQILNKDMTLAVQAVSSISYNPEKSIHKNALNQVLNNVLDEKIKEQSAVTNLPRSISFKERNYLSKQIFEKLLDDNYVDVQAVPVEITQSQAEFAIYRQQEAKYLKQLNNLKEQLDNTENHQDSVDSYLKLRKELYNELHAMLPQFRVKYDIKKDQRKQSAEIRQFLSVWTPEKVTETIKLNEILKQKRLVESLKFSGTNNIIDNGVATTDELHGSLRLIQGHNLGMEDQLNIMYQNGKVSGKFRSGKKPRLSKFKVGAKWWNK
ncbi:hypothetical protein SS50377_20101 [Spironucleus salmonicida]|uniref:Uncharacterized protein n=1 Tax=Spironucleus salmonicida TaxID=348837 RepID=V6LLT8_9EUKA|nr:hypothetical protein SS50377_20101 [Spironucleus salmonicida]|eukprot:EST45158.1 Hypothetical protein SS50377_14730 [Spironucleus salmonicida]